jgi:RNA polymerase sigma-54 factor
MALEQKLHLKLAQKLVMTPTLQQAIKLLQLSRLELEQAIAEELQANPLLEQIDEAGQGDGAGSAAAADDGGGTESGPGEAPPEAAHEADSFADVDLDALFANYLHDTARAAATWEDEEEAPLENSPNREESLFDALCAQLRLQPVEPAVAAAAEFVIGNLDAAGYLRMGEEEIAEQLGVTPEVAAAAVRAVQALEPAGIAARSVQECLALQLARVEEPEGEGDALALARRVVAEAFDELLHQRWERLEQRLGVDHQAVRAAVELIRHLTIRPGAQLGPIDNTTVEPDVIVTQTEAGWRVTLADDGLPRLRVSQHYLRMLRSRQADQATSGFLRERMRAALWFLRSVEQRHGTILKVAEAIVKRQSDLSRRRPAAPAPARAARRRRRHRHARVDRQPGGGQQVHVDAARCRADEVLLPLRDLARGRRRHLVGRGQGADPAAGHGRGPAAPALRRPDRPPAQPAGHPDRPANRCQVPRGTRDAVVGAAPEDATLTPR